MQLNQKFEKLDLTADHADLLSSALTAKIENLTNQIEKCKDILSAINTKERIMK